MFRNSNLTASWGRAFGFDLVDVYDRNREDPHVYELLLGTDEVAIGVPGIGRFHLEWEQVADALDGFELVIQPHRIHLPMTKCVRTKLQSRLAGLELRA